MKLLKKQGVAWFLTIVMIAAAIGIGYNKAHASRTPEPDLPSQTIPPGYSETIPPVSTDSFVWDNARVLSDRTVRALDERNDRLWNNYSVTVGVVTCDYGGDDLYGYALQCAEDMGLGGYDMIVVLDIRGDNYWLLQGDDIREYFSDKTASDYAYDYMEEPFAWGDYDSAVLQLTEMLEAWYGVYYF
ncbi:MAG: TPM domain-containing protein [Clostridiales bacterium]|nr:TPM domain-containing protein [Clostridiales bacterium]